MSTFDVRRATGADIAFVRAVIERSQGVGLEHPLLLPGPDVWVGAQPGYLVLASSAQAIDAKSRGCLTQSSPIADIDMRHGTLDVSILVFDEQGDGSIVVEVVTWNLEVAEDAVPEPAELLRSLG